MMRLWGVGTGLSGAAPCLLGRGRGAPGPGREVDEDSMPTGIRELAQGWGGVSEPDEDAERLAAIRRGAPVVTSPELRDEA